MSSGLSLQNSFVVKGEGISVLKLETLPLKKADYSQIYKKLINAGNEKAEKLYETEKRKEEAIKNIIAKDEAAPDNIDAGEIASYIVEAGETFSVDPVVIASIAQQETHFTQDVPVKNGSGIMQLTTISIKDMYLRRNVYDKALEPILDKYKTPENLMKALRKDPKVNIMLGTALYKLKLKNAKGNIHLALENYNGSPIKKRYAKEVMDKITSNRQTSFDNIA